MGETDLDQTELLRTAPVHVPNEDEIRRAVDELLGRLSEDEVESVELEQLTGGASRTTWALRAGFARGPARDLILQLHPRLETEFSVAVEVEAISLALAAGVPAPKVLLSGEALDGVCGSYLLMERAEGETNPRRILRSQCTPATRRALARDCGDALARIHSVDPGRAAGFDKRDTLSDVRSLLDEQTRTSAAFELAMAWLDRHRPPTDSVTLVHGDFRNGNLVVSGGRLNAVLDWEVAHLGDPYEDLGWFFTRQWRFGAALPGGGFAEYSEVLDAYERCAGWRPDLRTIKWWEVLGSTRWGALCMRAGTIARHLGPLEGLEPAVIARKVVENEYDALSSIESVGW